MFVQLISSTASIVSILVAFVSFVVYRIQRRIQFDRAFQECAKSLHSDNPVEQEVAAIMLREYLHGSWWGLGDHAQEAKNLITVLLRQSISVDLQKTLADGFSFASNMDGQDMQYVNMLNVSIKPKSAVDYEIKHCNRFKHRRISMRKADFFHAVIQESNINFVDATGAVFYCALLKRTSFHNCILCDADFRCTNVHQVSFDSDCLLEGARFAGAVGVETAMVKLNNGEKYTLANFLDNAGVFHYNRPKKKYETKNNKIKIFVSKLGAMDSQQTLHYRAVLSLIKELDNIQIETIERDNYTSISQLTDVETRMETCDGCVIFAFEYLHVNAGHIHKNIVGDDCKVICEGSFASPWLHIETALANGKQMPCMIIYDGNLCRDGMFDDKIIKTDKNLFAIPYSDTLSSRSRGFVGWISQVREYHSSK